MSGISQNTRRLLHWIGSGGVGFVFFLFYLVVVGIGFVVLKLAQYRDQIDLGKLAGPDWLTLLLLVMVCGLSGVLLALAWRALLRHVGVTISFPTAVRIYGISQIAKYVPSNVVHLLGRQALASAEELPNCRRCGSWAVCPMPHCCARLSRCLCLMAPSRPGPQSFFSRQCCCWASALRTDGLAQRWAARSHVSSCISLWPARNSWSC